MIINHIGIIGFGNMGLKYFKILKDINKNTKITLIRSQRKKNIHHESMADHVVDSVDSAIKKGIQCAFICSPSSEHSKQALILAKNKIHYFVEKPISNSMKNLKSLINTTKRKKVHAHVGYVLQELRSFKKLKKKINLKNVSTIYCEALSYLPKWKKDSFKNYPYSYKNLGGGVLLELSHEIDYIRNIFGEIKFVSAQYIYSNNLKINVESGANLTFYLTNNIIVNLILNFDSKINSRKCRINLKNGFIIWDIARDNIISENKKYKKENIKYAYKNQILNFLKKIKTNKLSHTSLLNSVQTLKVIVGAFKSNKLKKVIKV